MFFKDCTDEDLQGVEDNFFYSAERMPEFFKSDFKKTDGYARESIGAILGSDQFQDEVSVLSKSQIAKAFICGEHERAINNRYYDTLDFPNTWQNKLHEIPNASHFPQWENPEAFNELVERFISSNREP
jgi:pimeloyl-ACP methyl ester carboxylesterase